MFFFAVRFLARSSFMRLSYSTCDLSRASITIDSSRRAIVQTL